jgi:hypothetical protein
MTLEHPMRANAMERCQSSMGSMTSMRDEVKSGNLNIGEIPVAEAGKTRLIDTYLGLAVLFP